MERYIPSPQQWVRDQVELYESSGGKEGTTLRDTGLPVVIVTHRGRKTGAVRKTPVMRVRADDGLHCEPPPPQQVQNARDLVAGIDDQGFARERVANDGAIALQHADGNGDVNQTFLCGIEGRQAPQVVSHPAIIASDSAAPFPRSGAQSPANEKGDRLS